MAKDDGGAESTAGLAKARARTGGGNREAQIAMNARVRGRRIRSRLAPRSRLGNRGVAGPVATLRPSHPISSHSGYPAVLTSTQTDQWDQGIRPRFLRGESLASVFP